MSEQAKKGSRRCGLTDWTGTYPNGLDFCSSQALKLHGIELKLSPCR